MKPSIAILGLWISSSAWAESPSDYVLFKANKGRVRSRIEILKTPQVEFTQPNYFKLVDGNPLIKVWIENEIKKEMKEANSSAEETNEVNDSK